MTLGERADKSVDRQSGDYLLRPEFYLDGVRLWSAVRCHHWQGGGNLMWGWMADSFELHGEANAANQHLVCALITPADYYATTNGGPYADLNGTNQYYSAGDRTWAEIGTETALIWMWVNADTLATNDRIICSKWGVANNYQWHLYWDLGNTAFQLEVSANGLAISAVTSTYTETTGEWYFVAGYFTPSDAAGLRIYVREANDVAMTLDTAASPAAVFTGGSSNFEIGSENGGANAWDGKIGVGAMRLNVPFASIDAYVARLYALTRVFYRA